MSSTKIAEIWCDIAGCPSREQAEDGDNIVELRNFLREERGWTRHLYPGLGLDRAQMIDVCPDCDQVAHS